MSVMLLQCTRVYIYTRRSANCSRHQTVTAMLHTYVNTYTRNRHESIERYKATECLRVQKLKYTIHTRLEPAGDAMSVTPPLSTHVYV
jgi:hypothetical protein